MKQLLAILSLSFFFLSGFAQIAPPFPAVCSGSTIVLTGSLTGPSTWASANDAIATVNASGVVTGTSTASIAQNVIISHTNGITTETVTVTVKPSAPITGTTAVCTGMATVLHTYLPGPVELSGTWSSANPSVATINPLSGNVSGIAPGTATISKVFNSGCVRTETVTVVAAPAAITGPSTVCPGFTATFGNSVSGGTWSSPDISIDAATGVATGFVASDPTVTIVYSMAPSCLVTKTVSVNTASAAISPTDIVKICMGTTVPLSAATPGGTWSSSNITVATVDAFGVVTPVSAPAYSASAAVFYTATITYSLGSSCFSTRNIRVYPNPPVPAAASGLPVICVGDSLVFLPPLGVVGLSDTPWLSSDESILMKGLTLTEPTRHYSGIFTGVSAGTATITFVADFNRNKCMSSEIVTVNQTVPEITGPGTVCKDGTIVLGNADGTGSWISSNPAIASISLATGSSCTVTGNAPGTALITYKLPSMCSSYKTVMVYPNPADIGGPPVLCVGNTATYVSAPAGGSWTSSDAARLTINASGLATGIAAGTANITYTTAGGCYSVRTIMVHTSVGAIAGNLSICQGATSVLTDGTPGGAWSSSNPIVAPVSAGGVVTGMSPGVSVISYVVSAGCYSMVTVTVHAQPGPITGAGAVCEGSYTTLGNSVGGGTWSSSNTYVATVSGLGVVAGLHTGSSVISYIVTGGCNASRIIAVDPLPHAGSISGPSEVCIGGTILLVSEGDAGGSWTSSNEPVATVDPLGVVTGVTEGASNISYIVTNGCGISVASTNIVAEICCLTNAIRINTGYNPLTNTPIAGRPGEGGPAPIVGDPKWVVAAVSPDALAAIAAETGFTAIVPLGQAGIADMIEPWAYSATSNWITALNAHGYHTSGPGNYSMTLERPFTMCTDDEVVFDVDIANDNYISAVLIDGISIGMSEPVFNHCAGFTHYSYAVSLSSGAHTFGIRLANPAYAYTVYNLTGLNLRGTLSSVTGINSLVREDEAGCSSYTCVASRHAPGAGDRATAATRQLMSIPNPNTGSFRLKGTVTDATTANVTVEITDMLGKKIFEGIAATREGEIDQEMTLGPNVANGVYVVKVNGNGQSRVIRFVLNR